METCKMITIINNIIYNLLIMISMTYYYHLNFFRSILNLNIYFLFFSESRMTFQNTYDAYPRNKDVIIFQMIVKISIILYIKNIYSAQTKR